MTNQNIITQPNNNKKEEAFIETNSNGINNDNINSNNINKEEYDIDKIDIEVEDTKAKENIEQEK